MPHCKVQQRSQEFTKGQQKRVTQVPQWGPGGRALGEVWGKAPRSRKHTMNLQLYDTGHVNLHLDYATDWARFSFWEKLSSMWFEIPKPYVRH